MATHDEIEGLIAGVTGEMHDKLRVGGADLHRTLSRTRRQLPHRIQRQARQLAEAEPLAAHPRLRRTLNAVALEAAASEVSKYLSGIDVANRRKGWWLSLLGGVAVNLLLLGALLVLLLRWRGIV
jgi:hypothetical protein